MSGITDDPKHPDLKKYSGNEQPGPQNDIYLVLPASERAKGFVRPVREVYRHTKCGVETHMGRELAETYARNPKFYGATYCVECQVHRPVEEFVWLDGEVVGS